MNRENTPSETTATAVARDKIIARKVYARTVSDGYLRATAELHQLAGNKRPHFSVTGELWQSHDWYRNGQDGRLHECGAIHERILRAFPQLAPVVAVHLADDTGTPMHAEANGWYAYSGEWHAHDATSRYSTPRTDTPHQLAAKILRVTPDELPAGMDREQFGAYVASLAPRWQADADRALAIIRAAS